jgi:hypothetical protein
MQMHRESTSKIKHKSISSSAQYVTLQKYISHPSIVTSFSEPTNKTKTGTANSWETTNSKPLGPNIMIGQSETGSGNHIIFITVFSGRLKMLGQDQFAKPNQHVLTFVHPILNCRVAY